MGRDDDHKVSLALFAMLLDAQEPVLIKSDLEHMSLCAWFLKKPRAGHCLGELS